MKIAKAVIKCSKTILIYKKNYTKNNVKYKIKHVQNIVKIN